MIFQRRYFALALCLAMISLTGCTAFIAPRATTAAVDPSPRMSLIEAKEITLTNQREIAVAIPAVNVGSLSHQTTGTLLNCSGGKYLWSGSSRIALTPGSSVSELLKQVRDRFSGTSGYRALLTTTRSGKLSVEINGPNFGDSGANFYFVDEAENGTVIEIMSFSPCFYMPEDEYAGGTF
jgi:hypothetical protein